MQNYNKNCSIEMPDITVYMNCDTCLAINLSFLELTEYDEFIFNIKNYNYIDSASVFLLRVSPTATDKNGEVLFKIDPDISKKIKPSAFYNFAILKDVNNPHEPTEYQKLTGNGKIILDYGAHDLALPDITEVNSPFNDVLSARLEPADTVSNCRANGTIINLQLEACQEQE